MSSLRGWARRILLFSCTASLASSSAAQVLVLTPPGDPPALSHADLAWASGEGGDVAWLSLRVRRGPVAIVAALPETTSAEPAPDAWFRALEDTASPNVLPPSGQTDCGQRSSFVHVSWPRSTGVSGDEVLLERPDDVLALLDAEGLRSEGELPSGQRYLVWSWPDPDGELSTRTLRLVGFRGPVTFEPPAASPVSVTVLSPAALGMTDESPSDELRVTLFAGQRRTDYLAALSAWLGRERRPLLEARSSTSVFRWSVSGDRFSVPPLVLAYARAVADELTDVDADDCAEELRARADAPQPAAGGCGAAADAHYALAATGPRPVLQRFELLPRDPLLLDSFLQGGAQHDPWLRAARLDDSACLPIAPEPPSPPTTGAAEPRPIEPIVEEETVVVADRDESCTCSPGREPGYRDTSQTTVSCGGDTTGAAGDDSCSSDSSSTSDDSCSSDSSSTSDDSCSSDSSSTSDDSCSSDSSSTSDDSCSSDSSSTSDDSCSGSSDSGYDGDTCTGRAAPEAAPKATQQSLRRDRGGRPRRLRLSLGALALSAVLLPIRRRKRGPSR